MGTGIWDPTIYLVGYTHILNLRISTATSSQARSNWKYNPVGMNTNEPNLTSSLVPHKIVGSLGATFNLIEKSPTTFSFYEGQSGRPFSYKEKRVMLTIMVMETREMI